MAVFAGINIRFLTSVSKISGPHNGQVCRSPALIGAVCPRHWPVTPPCVSYKTLYGPQLPATGFSDPLVTFHSWQWDPGLRDGARLSGSGPWAGSTCSVNGGTDARRSSNLSSHWTVDKQYRPYPTVEQPGARPGAPRARTTTPSDLRDTICFNVLHKSALGCVGHAQHDKAAEHPPYFLPFIRLPSFPTSHLFKMPAQCWIFQQMEH